jgi:hypothetical protein
MKRAQIVTNCYTDDNNLPPLAATKIGVRDSYRRIGIVFCTQLMRHFTRRRLEAEALGLEGFEMPSGALGEGWRGCVAGCFAWPRRACGNG